MKLILNLLLVLAFPFQMSFQFVDVTEELNRVEKGEVQARDLEFDYQWAIFLDTGFYESLSKFEDFDTEFNPEMVVNSLENVTHKSLKLRNDYSNIMDVINESEIFHNYINPDNHEISEPVPVVGSKALLSIGNIEYQAYYLVEVIQPSIVDVVQVGSVHADVIPQSVLDEMNKIEEKKSKKKKN